MKKFKKLLAGVITFAVLMTSAAALTATPVSAASGNTVTVYYENDLKWTDVYCYLWQGQGALKGCSAWPGYKMTKVSGTTNWYSYTFTTTEAKFNVLFNNNNGKQTANHTPADLATTKNAYWFTPLKSTSANGEYQNGPSGYNVTVFTAAKEGFPKAAATSATSSTAASSTTSKAATTATTAATSTPSTGDNGQTAVIFFAVTSLAALAAASTVLIKKRVNEK